MNFKKLSAAFAALTLGLTLVACDSDYTKVEQQRDERIQQ